MTHPSFCVLASGSSGNCSALCLPGGGVLMIDLGLSPRRTLAALDAAGIAHEPVLGVLVTHLDSDHFNPGWAGVEPLRRLGTPTLHLHRAHLGRARREGFLYSRAQPFDDGFSPAPGVRAEPFLGDHDQLGVCSFRIECDGGGTMGFATDLGRATDPLCDHLAGVDVLAIESNYCPKLQEASPRPAFLKRRIMGGRGHLSNHECAQAVRRIAPASHVVLIHLSRQCNTPELAKAPHADAPYTLTISRHDTPTPWIRLTPGGAAPKARSTTRQPMLWA
ncbi:MAG: MBL fold metallo-hydrolase [Phycisphaeraceae bacterium]|nr:MAG: MBL fold metallo-hydrolase [Phycisphaeraceae bacterium]